MSKMQEKNTAKTLLREKIDMIGLSKDQAAINVLDEVENKGVKSALIDGINHLLTQLDAKRKQEFKASLQKVIDKL